MKKILASISLFALVALTIPTHALAAGISVNGGGSKTVGQTFTATVIASGGEFNAFQGKIAVSGPLSVVSFSAGNANWITQPTANGSFSGALLGQKVTSFTVATIKLKATGVGTGTVSTSNVILKNGSTTLGTSGGSASFAIARALELPGATAVTSTTHPDQNVAYEATTVTLNWAKTGSVTGFAYLLDQIADTAPPSTVTDANTTVTYGGKAIGVYYFHIKAKNGDGWSTPTHFKITIKEPDPKVQESLAKPSQIEFIRNDAYINNIEEGTFSGFKMVGVTEENFTANVTLDPIITLPEGKTLSVKSDETGKFELLIDFPIKTGRYKLVVQGQNEKILTPVSDPLYFEISQKKGGQINILTADDANAPVVAKATEQIKKWYDKINYQMTSIVLTSLLLVSLGFLIWMLLRGRKDRDMIKHLKSFK
jgi:hypothetical protein